MGSFICPVCCLSPCDSLTFGISTVLGGDIFTICMACDRGMSMYFGSTKESIKGPKHGWFSLPQGGKKKAGWVS